jgi:transposase
MNPQAKLEQLNLEPTAKTEEAALIQSLIEQAERDAKTIQAKDVKIEALIFELAYYKRIRFSTKSEALAPLQRDVFEETWNTDISAIEAEVEQLQGDQTSETATQPFKRPRAGRQPLPDHLPRIEHRHEPEFDLPDEASLRIAGQAPYTDPYVRCCGRGPREQVSIPIRRCSHCG